MSLAHTPLDEAQLPPGARKVAGATAPMPLRLMAARGLSPLAPIELVVAVYQLAAVAALDDASAEQRAIREAAERSARELPDAVLVPGLAAASDPRVLDFFAVPLVVARRDRPAQAILRNPATDSSTFARMAERADDAVLEQIAQNEERLLAHAPIVAALYLNPRTRMSTAQRALELAIRNGVRVDGIPCFDEVKAAIEGEAGGGVNGLPDEAFAAVLSTAAVDAAARAIAAADRAREGEASEDDVAALEAEAQRADEAAERGTADKAVEIGKLNTGQKLRLASLGNAFARAILVRDTNRVVAMAAVKHPGVTEYEAERFAQNRALHEDVIRYLATQRQFTKRYTVKVNLVNNPKTPLASSMVLIGYLTPRDLRSLGRSKGIPSALAKAAQALIAKRESR